MVPELLNHQLVEARLRAYPDAFTPEDTVVEMEVVQAARDRTNSIDSTDEW